MPGGKTFRVCLTKKPQGKRTCGKGSRKRNYRTSLQGGTHITLIWLVLPAMGNTSFQIGISTQFIIFKPEMQEYVFRIRAARLTCSPKAGNFSGRASTQRLGRGALIDPKSGY